MATDKEITSVLFEELELFVAGLMASQTNILDRYQLNRSNLRRDINMDNELLKIKEDGKGIVYRYQLPEYYIYVDLGVRGLDETPPGAQGSPFAYKNMNVSRDMVDSIEQWISRSGKVNIYGQDKQKAKGLKRATLNLGNTEKTLTRANLRRNAAFAVAKGVKKGGIRATKFVVDSMTSERFQNLADRIAEKTGQKVMVSLIDSLK